MAVMVNGGGAGGGGWVDITDSVTLGRGKSYVPASSSSDGHIENDTNGAYVLINVEPGERYRVTGWMGYSGGTRYLYAILLDDNDTVLAGSFRDCVANDQNFDAYGIRMNVFHSGGAGSLYAPIEVAIPKLSGVAKLMVFHGGTLFSTYDDVIVEKYIG